MPARFGSTGGLSQPRRDTVDPKGRFRAPSSPVRQSNFNLQNYSRFTTANQPFFFFAERTSILILKIPFLAKKMPTKDY